MEVSGRPGIFEDLFLGGIKFGDDFEHAYQNTIILRGELFLKGIALMLSRSCLVWV